MKAPVALIGPKGTIPEVSDDIQWYYMSPEKLETHHNRLFGFPLGEMYNHLFHEVTRIYEKWAVVKSLYSSIGRVAQMDEPIRRFFCSLLDILGETLILHLARLTDESKQGGHENVSILALAEAIKEPCIRSRIDLLVEEAKKKTADARVWRNKSIAHRDRKVTLKEQTDVDLPSLDEQYIEEALCSIGEILVQLKDMYMDTATVMEWTPMRANDDVESLIYHLEFASYYLNDREKGLALQQEFDSRKETEN